MELRELSGAPVYELEAAREWPSSHTSHTVIIMRKTLLAIASVALVLGAAACSDITGTGNITGSYQLETLNGSSLPAISYQDNFEQDQMLSDTFTIYSDGTYTDDYTLRVSTQNGTSDQTFRDVGTYQRNNSALQFRDSATGNIFTGSITSNTLTITQFGDTYVFRK
jgi:hypothetical protein